jgi:hypothetical protein
MSELLFSNTLYHAFIDCFQGYRDNEDVKEQYNARNIPDTHT